MTIMCFGGPLDGQLARIEDSQTRLITVTRRSWPSSSYEPSRIPQEHERAYLEHVYLLRRFGRPNSGKTFLVHQNYGADIEPHRIRIRRAMTRRHRR